MMLSPLAKKITQTLFFNFSAFLLGIILLLMPAASSIFRLEQTLALTDQQYGILFLPMITMAIAASLLFQKLFLKWGNQKIFCSGLFCNFMVSVAFVLASAHCGTHQAGFWILFVLNFFLGAGFGLMLSSMNVFMIHMYASKRDAALTGLHSCLGMGSAAAPILVGQTYKIDNLALSGWIPLIGFVVVFILMLLLRLMPEIAQVSSDAAKRRQKPKMQQGIKLFLIGVVLYGICESIIGNWSPFFLQMEKGFSLATSSYALALFWACVTVGRVLAALLTLRFDSRYFYRVSPVIVFCGLLFVMSNTDESKALYGYLILGLGCSYFLPLSVSLSSKYFPMWKDYLSSLVLGALMAGVGIGSSLSGYLKEIEILTLSRIFQMAAISIFCVIGFVFYLTRQKTPTEAL